MNVTLTRVVVYRKDKPSEILAIREGKISTMVRVEALSQAKCYFGEAAVGNVETLTVVKNLETGAYIQ